MFGIFKKQLSSVQENKISLKQKSTNEIIEEIHETFYSEVDKLLEQAKISKPLDTDKQDVIDKSTRLKQLGFNSTKEVSLAEEEIKRLDLIKKENNEKAELIEAINYFSFKYPFYKFITENSVRKICEKYGLVYGEVSQYKGDVPTKNLIDIENFNIDKKDECYYSQTIFGGVFGGKSNKNYISYEEMFPLKKVFKNENEFDFEMRQLRLQMNTNRYFHTQKEKCSLEIAAPIKDFNMEGMELKGLKLSKIEIPDPIVLKPVFFKGKKHYLIVTAWGLEASDELVINQINN